MNPTEKRALRKVIARLRVEAEGVSPHVKEALRGPARLYVETWVLGPLELLIKEDRTLAELKLAADL